MSGLKYDDLRDYLDTLKGQWGVQIEWDVIRQNQIISQGPKLMGLQIADAVASGFYSGVQLNSYGFCEDRYAKMLKPTVYKHSGRYNGYGLKFWPKECEPILKNENHLAWLKDYYDFI